MGGYSDMFICSFFRRLGPFLGVQQLEFNVFLRDQKNKYSLGV